MLHLDWCSFVFKPEWLPEEFTVPYFPFNDVVYQKDEFLIDVVDMDPWSLSTLFFPDLHENEELFVISNSRSGMRYKTSLALGNDFFIHYDERIGSKGVYFEFPSHGLHILYTWLKINPQDSKSFENLCAALWDRGCRFSRIDFCKDVKKEGCIFTPSYLNKAFMEDRIVTKSVSKDFICNGEEGKVEDARYIFSRRGQTFYLGSLKTRKKLLRVYDKELESKDKEYPYYRWEVELHSNYARRIQQLVVEGKTVTFKDLIQWFCYITEESGYNKHNRAKASPLPAWKEFVRLEFSEENVPDTVDLTVPAKSVNINSKRQWLHDITPTIASMLYAFDDERMRFNSIAENLDNFNTWCCMNKREDLLSFVDFYSAGKYHLQEMNLLSPEINI